MNLVNCPEEKSLVDYLAYKIYRVNRFSELKGWQQEVIVFDLMPKYTVTA